MDEVSSVATAIAWITSNLDLLAQIVGVFAVIATLTPNTSDNAIVDAILKVINGLGANVGKAKNDPADPAA